MVQKIFCKLLFEMMKYPNDAKFRGSKQNMAMTILAPSVFLLHSYTCQISPKTRQA